MSADNRTVATDALETLGKIIDETAGRDAIHLAVEPVVAGETLGPGMHIGFLDDGTVGRCGTTVGIVDPFVNGVAKGERFWLVVYPRQITSLRHVWTHPAFGDEPAKPAKAADKAASEAWIRNFIDYGNAPRDYDLLINAAIGDHHKNQDENDGYHYTRGDNEYLHFNGRDACGEIPPEFWDHVEVVTGRKVPFRPASFSCSC